MSENCELGYLQTIESSTVSGNWNPSISLLKEHDMLLYVTKDKAPNKVAFTFYKAGTNHSKLQTV